jgi:hypothetical protein
VRQRSAQRVDPAFGLLYLSRDAGALASKGEDCECVWYPYMVANSGGYGMPVMVAVAG